ncbi:MAG: potassium channel family protein [Phreatobacter sp.]|nr:potassium channel family protein [Phreatobacter sp.]
MTSSSPHAEQLQPAPLKERVRELYEAETERAERFRYGLLAFDLVTISFVVATSFMQRRLGFEIIDFLIGVIALTDFLARMWIARRPWRELSHPLTWADIIAIISFLAPITGEGAGFFRVLRTLRLMRTYQLVKQLRGDSAFFRKNQEIIFAATNLCVFIFIMTGIVYASQHQTNPGIANYVDALYFTVTSLTTTGYGDITLPGTPGRLISVTIMIFGVTLFLRLAQVLFRPTKVRHPCPTCGLQRHEPDAVHCKACGTVLNIPNED